MDRHFFETILANLQSGIIVIDRDCRIEMVNNYVADCCGLPLAEFAGKSLNDFSPKLYENVLAGKTSDEIPANVCGVEKVIGFNLSPLTDKDGQQIGSIINLKDLTEIMAIRHDLRQKQRLAAMGEIVGKVAHEMRNPLFGVTAAAQILEMELPLTESHKELMASLLRESRRLNNLVEVLLECTSGSRLHKKRVDLVRMLAAAVRDVAATLQKKGIALKQDFEPELWLTIDAEKLKRAIIHLLNNAAEASAPGSEVTLSAGHNDAGVFVTVSDQGEGILSENLDKVFEIFYTTRKNHSGLGLPSCRSILTAHNGTLTPVYNPEGGMAFMLQLPGDEVPQ